MSLICLSAGGPVNRVTWRRNNQLLMIDDTRYEQIQTIVDAKSVLYNNTLNSDSNENLVGIFTCIVQNIRGSDSMTISTNGRLCNHNSIILIYKCFIGVVIRDLAETYMVGINVTITCHSDTATDRMEWLTNNGTVIFTETLTQQLDLHFTPVNDSVHGCIYVCRVTRKTNETVEQNFTMNVEGKQLSGFITI